MAEPARIGVIGCGNISETYLRVGKTFSELDLVACADIDIERAKARAAQFDIPHAYTVDELLGDPAIEIVLNLTIPRVHADVAVAALQAGKSVYNEKPLGLNRTEGARILDLAREKGLLVGCAPDTFLGAGLQTCRDVIDDGVIGEPIGATAFMLSHGPEGWHPDPIFFFEVGGGPMFDMGPYYLTALVALMGPIRRVTGSTRISFPTRTITSKPKYGTEIVVQTPTHLAGVMDFAAGAIATIVTSFDVWATEMPRIEIYGTKGTLSVPDPNTFGGPVRVRKAGDSEWSDVPLTHGNAENSRSLGLADMAAALRTGQPHRASGELAYHVLDVMQSFDEASRANAHIQIASTCPRPEPLPRTVAEQ